MHYRRAKKAGSLPPRKTTADRFWEKVEKTGSCWNWTGAKRAGYGKFSPSAGKQVTAHRYALKLHGSPAPEGMDVDHICGNRACVNPDHLRITTRKQNLEHVNRLRKDNTSGYIGVTRKRNKWHARVVHNGTVYLLGSHPTPEVAGEVARLKRLELFTHNDRDRVA
ncbi:HNH endonuclease [Brevibacterium casei CIP 102111]|uniref:HNH endonuclease n=2 Tax=Brevibacterium casei TaxID=33889 RepID=A0A2H1IWC5_9MICO|nr:HNH endonuclease [Brevibacterium casei CIP 102111]